MVSEDDTLNQLLSFQLAEIYEANQVYRRRSPSDSSPIVRTEALELFHDGDTETEVQKRLSAGEPVSVVGPLARVPRGAIPIAAVIPAAERCRPRFTWRPRTNRSRRTAAQRSSSQRRRVFARRLMKPARPQSTKNGWAGSGFLAAPASLEGGASGLVRSGRGFPEDPEPRS